LHYYYLTRRPPPLQYILFPYTTLFRSSGLLIYPAGNNLHCSHIPPLIQNHVFLVLAARSLQAIEGLVRQESPYSFHKINKIVLLDRKSTRLNSSHVAISYAVFCLKKKK